jgi:hypothetical protein
VVEKVTDVGVQEMWVMKRRLRMQDATARELWMHRKRRIENGMRWVPLDSANYDSKHEGIRVIRVELALLEGSHLPQE